MRKLLGVVLVLVCAGGPVAAQQKSEPATTQRIADAEFLRLASAGPTEWSDGLGTLLAGMDAAWDETANGHDFAFVRRSVDSFVRSDGTIADRPADECGEALLGRQVLLLYRVTQDKKYYAASKTLQNELAGWMKSGPAVPESARKEARSPGLCPIGSFLAEYASVFQEPQDREQIARRFASPTGGSHGDSAGTSPDRLVLFITDLVDTLPYYPQNDPDRARLQAMLKRTVAAAIRSQDPHSGLWTPASHRPQIGATDVSPANSLFVYALAKGVRFGYLPRADLSGAERTWQVLRDEQQHQSDNPSLKPDGDAADPATRGALLLAASEMDLQPRAAEGPGRKVLLDAWYNSQRRENAAGQSELFHYKWDDESNSGFSFFGHIFRSYGMTTSMLDSAPTLANLRGAQIYIIVSPDNPAKNPQPHSMNAADAEQVATWVRNGGVLLLMENDPANADIPHMDILADRFGLHFNNVLVHHVVGDEFAMGRIDLRTPAPPFRGPHVLYMKDTCSLTLSKDARPLLQWKGDTLMAVARYGKGTVLAVTDPWLYNEYTDGRKLPPEYDNFAAGVELVHWLLQQP